MKFKEKLIYEKEETDAEGNKEFKEKPKAEATHIHYCYHDNPIRRECIRKAL